MYGSVKWCSVCNAAPADGVLTVLLDDIPEPQELDACEGCVNNPERVEFV